VQRLTVTPVSLGSTSRSDHSAAVFFPCLAVRQHDPTSTTVSSSSCPLLEKAYAAYSFKLVSRKYFPSKPHSIKAYLLTALVWSVNRCLCFISPKIFLVFHMYCSLYIRVHSRYIGSGRRYSISYPWNKSRPKDNEDFLGLFSHLKADRIHSLENQFIRLPQLYDQTELAKGITPSFCESFFMTKNRLTLWKEMYEEMGQWPKRGTLNGICLSGPNGVGKSSVLHMLASVAHVNDWIVLYIVCITHSR
jgi:hypothetical protein